MLIMILIYVNLLMKFGVDFDVMLPWVILIFLILIGRNGQWLVVFLVRLIFFIFV